MVSKTLGDLLFCWGFFGFVFFYYSMFSFTNAHTAAQTALYSEYNEVCGDTSVAEVARGICALFLSSDIDIECLTTVQVLFPFCCLTTRRILCLLSVLFVLFSFCYVLSEDFSFVYRILLQ